MLPGAVLRAWKKLLQQFVLGAHVYVNHAVAQSELTSSHMTLIERSLRIALREEFDVAIHGLASWSVHDNVNGDAVFGGDDLCVAAKEAKDFLFSQGIRDLRASYMY